MDEDGVVRTRLTVGVLAALVLGVLVAGAVVTAATGRWGFWGLAAGAYAGSVLLALPALAYTALADRRTRPARPSG